MSPKLSSHTKFTSGIEWVTFLKKCACFFFGLILFIYSSRKKKQLCRRIFFNSLFSVEKTQFDNSKMTVVPVFWEEATGTFSVVVIN
jgi:hypothetical protein